MGTSKSILTIHIRPGAGGCVRKDASAGKRFGRHKTAMQTAAGRDSFDGKPHEWIPARSRTDMYFTQRASTLHMSLSNKKTPSDNTIRRSLLINYFFYSGFAATTRRLAYPPSGRSSSQVMSVSDCGSEAMMRFTPLISFSATFIFA